MAAGQRPKKRRHLILCRIATCATSPYASKSLRTHRHSWLSAHTGDKLLAARACAMAYRPSVSSFSYTPRPSFVPSQPYKPTPRTSNRVPCATLPARPARPIRTSQPSVVQASAGRRLCAGSTCQTSLTASSIRAPEPALLEEKVTVVVFPRCQLGPTNFE